MIDFILIRNLKCKPHSVEICSDRPDVELEVKTQFRPINKYNHNFNKHFIIHVLSQCSLISLATILITLQQ